MNQQKPGNRGLRLFRLISFGVILFLLLTWLAGVYYYVREISADLDATLEITLGGHWSAAMIRADERIPLWLPQQFDKED